MGSYYDIDAILTDAQKVPCTFDLDIPGLGYLDDNAGGDVCLPSPPPSISSMNYPQTLSRHIDPDTKITDQSRNPCLPSPLAQHPPRRSTPRPLIDPALHARPPALYRASRVGGAEGESEDCGSEAAGESLLRFGCEGAGAV